MEDFKAADAASKDLIAITENPADLARAHYQRGSET
jgi:hypothetical protein